MKIISWNVNGLRSVLRKNFLEFLASADPDILCLQETKASAEQVEQLWPAGYTVYWNVAQKKGYSGTGIYSKTLPDTVITGFGNPEFDAEGRYVQCDFANLSVISVYCPSGSSSEERQLAKFRFMEVFLPHLDVLRSRGREVVICGDWNIAHKEIDLKNWKGNLKNSGFLPEERAWLSRIFDELQLVDVFRKVDDRAEQYTWWSNRGQAYANNVGWRIDYQIATPGIAAKAKAVSIYKEQRFSDHAPLIIEYAD